MKPLFSQKFAILTAENPRYGSAEGGNAAFEQEMKTKGLKFTPMKGKYGVPENSYLVENPDHQDILSWGKKYGQDSVIVSDGGHHKMVYTNGLHEGLWHEGHSISIHDKEPEDFYSTINLNGKPTHFTIDFDMDTKHGLKPNQSKSNELEKAKNKKTPEEIIYAWQSGGKRSVRNKIPAMEQELKNKGLQQLSNLTRTKVNLDGTTSYLLHRGSLHTPSEYKNITSWTPYINVADSFARDYEKIHQKPAHVESTWINEKEIHSLPFAYPSLDKDQNLWDDEKEVLVSPILKNPNTYPDTRKSNVRVALNPKTHSDTLRQLSTDSDLNVRVSVAKNPNTHPDILHKLSTDSEDYVRYSVAQNPNTYPDILHKLSNDSNNYIRRSVAKNPNIHPDILHKLSNDSDNDVRRSVAENPQFKNLPLEIQQNLAESHDKDIAKRAKEELKRRGLQKSLKKSDSPKHLIHFSTTPNLTTLDPEFQGTAGRHSPETKHGKPTHPRVYFYEENTPTESVVTGGAKSKYVVKHPGHDKIIDIANDLENQQQAKQQWLQKPIGSMQDAYFKLLKDKGYLGFKNSASGLPNVVAMFHATPVHAEVPAPKDMAANPDWTKAEVPMSFKKSDVKEAVEKIKGPAKVSEVLSEAKPDMRAKILAALRKEKLAKMNGTGIPGAGGATPPMMRPPVPAAPASMAMSKADESESRMAKKDLKDIMEYAQALDKMVVESEDLEDWVDSKITVARQYLSDIAHYLSYENGQPTEELDKGDVISMKDKKVISTDTKAAPKELVVQQPKMPKIKRAPVLIQTVKLAKSDSKKAKFERCVLAVKKKSGDKVNPWAVCHASVDGTKKSEDLEKADMKVKEQEKPTKGMPQAKQLKADADLEKIKEGAENVAKAADKKKSELNKSGYFKEDKKNEMPKWHDPLKEQRESAAQEERELRPEHKMHIWAELEREHRQADKPKTQKPKEELKKKLILGEGKPSKATKKATPEEHKAIMDKLSAALDTVKVDTSPKAAEERKMLLEHVKHKLKGQK